MRGIILDPNSYNGIQRLSREQKGELLEVIFIYNNTGHIPEMSDMVGMAFDMMRGFFDTQIIKYKEKCDKNKENADKRWHKESDTIVSEGIKENAVASERIKNMPIKSNQIKSNQTKGNEIELNISSKEDTTSLIVEKGNEEINLMQKFLRQAVGVSQFKDSKERWYVTHCHNLMKKIGKDEFGFRLKEILSDPFKAKNSNKLEYLYKELKAFIHSPVVEEKKVQIKVY